jgi:hypothetical protein
VLGFDLVQPADARTKDHPGAECVELREINSRVRNGVPRGNDRKLRKAVNPLRFLGGQISVRRPIRDLSTELHFELGGVEMAYFAHAAFAGKNPLPKIGNF